MTLSEKNNRNPHITPLKLKVLQILDREKYLPADPFLLTGFLQKKGCKGTHPYLLRVHRELITDGLAIKKIIGNARKPKIERTNDCLKEGKKVSKNIIFLTKKGKQLLKEQGCKKVYQEPPELPIYIDEKDITPTGNPNQISREERSLLEKEARVFATIVRNNKTICYIDNKALKSKLQNKISLSSRMLGAFWIVRENESTPILVPVYNSGNFIRSIDPTAESSIHQELMREYDDVSEEIILGNSLDVLEKYLEIHFQRMASAKKSKKSHPLLIDPNFERTKYFVPLEPCGVWAVRFLLYPKPYRRDMMQVFCTTASNAPKALKTLLQSQPSNADIFHAETENLFVFLDFTFDIERIKALYRYLKLFPSKDLLIICLKGGGTFYKNLFGYSDRKFRLFVWEYDIEAKEFLL